VFSDQASNKQMLKVGCRHVHRLAVVGDQSSQALSQLAIFAAPPVDLGMNDSFVAQRLAGYTGAGTRQCLAPAGRDGLAAVFAMFQPFTSGHPRACAADRVAYGVIDLILHRAVARPSTGHMSVHSLPG